jgi:hypothetical protein
MSIAVDFGVTQVVDGNWGVYALVKKSLFAGGDISRSIHPNYYRAGRGNWITGCVAEKRHRY